jgi:activator of HSP90 ATPase
MGTVNKKYTIKAKPVIVFDYLTDKGKIERWTGSSAEMDVKEGGRFSLWEGAIYGINRKINISQIHQDWKEKTWENYSRVTINIRPGENGEVTEVELIHEDIPQASVIGISQGWDEYYFGPLIELVENDS